MNSRGPLAWTDAAPHPVYSVLAGMEEGARAALLARLPRRHFRAGEVVLREGEPNEHVLLVMSGHLTAERSEASGQFLLSHVGPGQACGEMSALSAGRSSATVRALSDSTLLQLHPKDLEEDEGGTVSLKLARLVVNRLLRTNARLEAKHAEGVAAWRLQLEAAVFSAKLFFCLALYVLVVGLSVPLRAYWPEEPLVSFFFIVGFFGVAWTFVTRVNADHAGFGMAPADFVRGTWRGLGYTVPLLVAVLGAKWAYLRQTGGAHTLFEPMLALENTPFAGTALWAAYLAGYVALSYAQEVVRTAIQGSLATYYRAGGFPDRWRSIAVSSLLFAGTHVHLSIVFALLSCVAGLYWGWIYQRENSYWAVAASHAVTGVWALFVVGVPY